MNWIEMQLIVVIVSVQPYWPLCFMECHSGDSCEMFYEVHSLEFYKNKCAWQSAHEQRSGGTVEQWTKVHGNSFT